MTSGEFLPRGQVGIRQDLMQKHKAMTYSLHLRYYGMIWVSQCYPVSRISPVYKKSRKRHHGSGQIVISPVHRARV